MISIEKALIPGILAGCVFLIVFTSLIASPHRALASTAPNEAQQALASINAAAQTVQDLSLMTGQAEQPQSAQPAVISTPVVEQQASGAEASGAEASGAEAAGAEAAGAEAAVAEAAGAEAAASAAQYTGECSLSGGYPESVRQWCGLIETYAAQNDVDANLIAAVMLQESGGNAQAYSKDGAVGLMQVMPRDGIAAGFMCINGPCFGSRPSTQELYDPEFNISYGTHMLAGLIRKHGSVRDALRAYGPMNMGYRYADIVLGIASRYQ